jgi:hypothetical protein
VDNFFRIEGLSISKEEKEVEKEESRVDNNNYLYSDVIIDLDIL